MKLIVGLGNPGEKYEDTRHNIGFLVVDYVARLMGVSMRPKGKSMVAELSLEDEKAVLIKPLTYMNLSGEAVQEALHLWPTPLDQILVIHDDLDLPFGRLRFKRKGSHGGHNGLRSIISHVESEHFVRLKIGIGRPADGDVIRYVLAPFTEEERRHLDDVVALAGQAVIEFIEGHELAWLMNKYNQKPAQR